MNGNYSPLSSCLKTGVFVQALSRRAGMVEEEGCIELPLFDQRPLQSTIETGQLSVAAVFLPRDVEIVLFVDTTIALRSLLVLAPANSRKTHSSELMKYLCQSRRIDDFMFLVNSPVEAALDRPECLKRVFQKHAECFEKTYQSSWDDLFQEGVLSVFFPNGRPSKSYFTLCDAFGSRVDLLDYVKLSLLSSIIDDLGYDESDLLSFCMQFNEAGGLVQLRNRYRRLIHECHATGFRFKTVI
jgi:hypothetical protein